MRKATRSQAYSIITAHLQAHDERIINYPDLDKLLDKASRKNQDKIKQERVVSLYLNLYENVHFLKKQRVINMKLWQDRQKEIEETCNHAGFKEQYYKQLKKKYNPAFQTFIGNIFKRV
jgi:DNA-binding phage protein